MKTRRPMYHLVKIVVLALLCLTISAMPALAVPFSYTIVTNEEVDLNHFRTVISIPASPSTISVKNAIDAGKSNNIVIDSVTKEGGFYVVEGHLISYSIKNNFLFNPWWNGSWPYRIENLISDGVRPYQISLNLSNATGTNNATHVFCGGRCNVNFTDIRFTLNNITLLPYWIEDNATGKVWINLTANGSVELYYGNPSATTTSNLFSTFSYSNLSEYRETDPGSKYTVVPNKVTVTSETVGASGLNRTIPGVNNFSVNFEFQYATMGADSAMHVLVGDAVTNPTWNSWGSNNGVGIALLNPGYLFAEKYVSGTRTANSTANPVMTANITYYATVSRVGSLLYSAVYTNPDRTTHVSGSPSTLSGVPVTTYTNLLVAQNDITYSGLRTYFIQNFRYQNIETQPPVWSTWQYPIISSWNNNYTNDDDLVFSIYENQVINFNATKRYSGDTINWFVNSVDQSNNFENITLNINTVGINNITATVTNSTYGHASVSWLVTLDMQLVIPSNGTTLYSPYPPAAPAVSFAWTSTGYPFYNLVISTDQYFNSVVSSVYTSRESANVYLLSGKTYFWKVRTYIDALTPGAWSGTSYFNLTPNYSLPANATGVYGVVYEKKSDDSLFPISDAVVSITNSTWSDIAISGTNGYYLFSGLKAGDVYTIRAVANGFETGSTEYVNVTTNTMTQKNLFLQICRSGFTCFYDQHFVRFTVQNIWFTKYAGVTAAVYKGSELTASDTKTTGTDGSVNFLLIKDQQYRITFINATAGISVTWTGYPSKTDYIIITDASSTSGWSTHGSDASTTTVIGVTTQTINDTHAFVNVSYNDTLAGTSNLRFYLNKTIPGDPNNQTVLQTISAGGSDQYNASFIVSGYGGNSYFVKVKIDHDVYGSLSYSYAVQFAALPGPLANFDQTFILMLFVGFILFVAGMFGQTMSEQGSAILVGLVWILAGIGVFSAANVGLNFYLGLTLASVIVIIMNINARGRQEGLQ